LALFADVRETGWMLTPISAEPVYVHAWGMIQLAIRCHPGVPVSIDELEGWLEGQVDELRSKAPHATIRLSRLMQSGPRADLSIGWLVELDLAEGHPLLDGPWLADSLRGMRLLGLQPTLFCPREVSTNGRAA
jgi:hypothetical protein